MYFGQLTISEATEDKLHRKHDGVTFRDVVDAIQWPAAVQAKWDDDEEHGRRVVAIGHDAAGRPLICWLEPLPHWEDDPNTWEIRTARWI